MKYLKPLFVLGFIFLVSCNPEPVEVTRVVEVEATRVVEVTREIPVTVVLEREIEVTREVEVTRVVERVVAPTSTPTPAATATPEKTVEEYRAEFQSAIIDDLEVFDDVDRVSTARLGDGVIYIELNTTWHSRDQQPPVTWEIITFMADAFSESTPLSRETIAGVDNFTLHLATYSADNRYRYQSETDHETLAMLANRQLTFEEWAQAADAGFR